MSQRREYHWFYALHRDGRLVATFDLLMPVERNNATAYRRAKEMAVAQAVWRYPDIFNNGLAPEVTLLERRG